MCRNTLTAQSTHTLKLLCRMTKILKVITTWSMHSVKCWQISLIKSRSAGLVCFHSWITIPCKAPVVYKSNCLGIRLFSEMRVCISDACDIVVELQFNWVTSLVNFMGNFIVIFSFVLCCYINWMFCAVLCHINLLTRQSMLSSIIFPDDHQIHVCGYSLFTWWLTAKL